jgi:hypothetical protein
MAQLLVSARYQLPDAIQHPLTMRAIDSASLDHAERARGAGAANLRRREGVAA